ncbi:DNA methyltransferase [Mycobacterium phage Omega]|uniref:DNA (cytosine-5-)-methyltransferase n=1 Tax=Mycobacterium phage Omega TaxID=2907835 RepID=Q854E1_BPMOM|nr:DNA methyltransferase [Mycobacterium phage Omega]AAN12767.1 hypothetical protein PBI_OMEGA_127 [Mycobacterium phage Omega]
MTLTHVDLFAGIGGFSLTLQRAGAKTVANVEIDKNCRQILARHYPDAVQFDDIKNVSGDDLRSVGFVPERGILTGGFPCQDISAAGRGAGLAGERSGLFWEIVRLLNELHPKWFILENVPRLLSIHGGRDMGTVVGALAGSGYGLAWRVLDAQFTGVPQRRRRIFIVGHLGDSGRASAEILFERQGVSGDSAEDREAGAEAAGATRASAENDRGRMTVSTLQGGGKRGYRIDAEAAAGGHLQIQSPL